MLQWAHLHFIPLWLFYPICSSPALSILSHLQFSRPGYFVPSAVLPSGYLVPFAVYSALGILSHLQFIPLWVSCPICSLSRSGYLIPFAVYSVCLVLLQINPCLPCPTENVSVLGYFDPLGIDPMAKVRSLFPKRNPR